MTVLTFVLVYSTGLLTGAFICKPDWLFPDGPAHTKPRMRRRKGDDGPPVISGGGGRRSRRAGP